MARSSRPEPLCGDLDLTRSTYRTQTLDARAGGLALAFTAALFILLLSLSGDPKEPPEPIETLAMFTLEPPIETPPDPKPVNQREVIADTPDEAAPAPGPQSQQPAPDILIVPPTAITLTDWLIPPVTVTADAPLIAPGAISEGDQVEGPSGLKGTGGDGIAGNGLGGAGNGKGRGSQLIASWSPRMSQKQLERYYPTDARDSGIEGVTLMKCLVLRRDRVRDCELLGEKPAKMGFGQAAINSQPILKVRVHNQVGRRIYNERVVIQLVFKPVMSPKPANEATLAQAEASDAAETRGRQTEPAPDSALP